VKRLSEGALLIDASIPVKELNERCGLGLPELADYNTLAGLILTSLGRIPASGEELIVQGVKLQVDKVAHRRILRVIASREPPAAVRESTEVNGVSAVAVEVQSSTSPKKK
jgi:CBS domain containing-hemolysin-like protein